MMERKTDHFSPVIPPVIGDTDETRDREAEQPPFHLYPRRLLFLSFFTTIISMRTPSLYSQDDPITAAMKPPPSETEPERAARLVAEAEAKRVSERIDEDLREERERLKKKKGDVKVRLSLLPYPTKCIHLHGF